MFILPGIKSTFPYKLVVLHIYVIFFLFIPMVIICGFLSPVQLFPVRHSNQIKTFLSTKTLFRHYSG